MDAESGKTSASIATTQATNSKENQQQQQPPHIDSMNSGIKSNAMILPSNSANSTAMTSS